MNRTKNVMIVFGISMLLAAIIVLLFILDKEDGKGKLISSILLPLWAFSLLPASIYVYNWLKTKTFFEGILIGLTISVIVPIIIAPFLMAVYYIDIIKNFKINIELKRLKE